MLIQLFTEKELNAPIPKKKYIVDNVSTGEKYKKEYPTAEGIKIRYYLGGVEWEDGLPVQYHFGDGRVMWELPLGEAPAMENLKAHLQYRITDHLGNTMVVFEDKNNDGLLLTEESTDNPDALEVIQRLWYYPFGMHLEGIGQQLATPAQDYRYNGKEKDEATGLYDYGFRWYDPAIGRFTGVDPIADQFAWVSVFNYAENEPVGHIDLWGLQKAKPRTDAQNMVIVVQGYTGTNPPNNKTQARNDPGSSIDRTGLGKINDAFSGTSNQVVTFSSSHSDNTINDAIGSVNDFKSANPDGKVFLVGHSLGGDNVVNIAEGLGNVGVELAVTLDIADYWDDDNASSNVKNFVNISQNNDFPGGEDVEGNGTTYVQNFSAVKSTHRSIDNDFVGTVIQMISNMTGVSPNSTPKVNSHEEVKRH
ncbi:MAG: RHS repeat-associated core domain-containing protein [Saprospiraceae bacterium]